MSQLLLKTLTPETKDWFGLKVGQFFDNCRAQSPGGAMLSGDQWRIVLGHFPAEATMWCVTDKEKVLATLGSMPVSVDKGLGLGFYAQDNDGPTTREATKLLFAHAEQHARSKNMKTLIGPICLNTWFPYRFRYDTGAKSHSWEPQNPIYYPKNWERAGFLLATRYSSHGYTGVTAFCDKMEKVNTAAIAKGFSFQSWSKPNFLKDNLSLIYRMSLEGFSGNYLFSPIDEATFSQFFMLQSQRYALDSSFMLMAPDGDHAGFLFAILDGDAIIIKTLVVREKYRGMNLSNALVYQSMLTAKSQGVERYVIALTIEGNISENLNNKGPAADWAHFYGLWQKEVGR